MVYTALYVNQPPNPSAADAFWLGSYPAFYAAIYLFAKPRARRAGLGVLLDIGIASAALATVSAALVVEALMPSAVALDPAAFVTNLLYPIADVGLVAAGFARLAAGRWRLSRELTLLTASFLVFAAADGVYLIQIANETYVPGGVLDWCWLFSFILAATAAVMRPQQAAARRQRTRGIIVPVGFGTIALAAFCFETLETNPSLMTVAFGALTMLFVIARMAFNHGRAETLLRASRQEALTDPLTALGNRRSLLRDLEQALESAEHHYLALFDLDGFKQYNDTFGHAAGDKLLRRIALRLEAGAGTGSRGYRLGGDEFCVLGPTKSGAEAHATVALISAAIVQRGDGFNVTASYGLVELPREVTDTTQALRLADRRMYAAKEHGRASAARQSADVLLQALHERDGDLERHVFEVSKRAVAVGQALGLDEGAVDQVREAARLHDIGKIAIPESIIDKPGPLDEEEWAFMRRHTVIGERIVESAPSLQGVARIVRSSHERYDGAGYPDGIAGLGIPLAARIVFACDAFDAMTSSRPYSEPMSVDVALAELRHCAGSQFDPLVVQALLCVIEAEQDQAAYAVAA